MNPDKRLFGLILLLIATLASGSNDIWGTLFKEKLREAALGDSNAQYEVGTLYQNGRGTGASRDQAIEWYRKAAGQDNQKAISRLELMKANESRFSRDSRRAEKGDPESQYSLGNMYTKGVGTPIDQEQARHWYEKAANQGNVKAGYKLGLMYYEGTGVRKNSKTAFKWFTIAAEKGNIAAQYYLGKLYAAGSGVRRNYTSSLEWYTRAVDGGFNQARGEMNDVAEKLKAQKQAPAPVKRTAVSRKKPAASGTTRNKPARRTSKTARNTSVMEDLMLATWNRNSRPVSYLPSVTSNCRTADMKIICYSDDLTRETGANSIRYRTKSIISGFSADGSFNVLYRNLVINATRSETRVSSESGAGYDDEGPDKGYSVKTGWGKEHILECTLKDSNTIACLKNKSYAFEVISQQKLAAGQ